MDLTSVVDQLLPGPGSGLDRVSRAVHDSVADVAQRSTAATQLVRGDAWLGHPAHPLVVALPIGAWSMTAWYDLRAARSGDPRHAAVADAALRVGVVGALASAVTGFAQFLGTAGAARRETTVHAALNNVALTLYLASWAARKRGRRRLGVRLSTVGLALVGVSGYLGGDLAYRHGVGVRQD